VTTLPIDTLEQVQEIVQSYCGRWQIEIFFKTLKSGCKIERRLFEKLPRTLNCLAVYSIIAWRVMYLCHLGRECPDLDCEVVFSPSEWKSVYRVVRREPLPETPPRLNEMVRMIATLGGFVDRPKNEPGPQTLWTGLQRLHCFSLAWDTFGPDQKININRTCVVIVRSVGRTIFRAGFAPEVGPFSAPISSFDLFKFFHSLWRSPETAFALHLTTTYHLHIDRITVLKRVRVLL